MHQTMRSLIERIEQQPLQYIGRGHYYFLPTDTIYFLQGDALVAFKKASSPPKDQKGLNTAAMYCHTTKPRGYEYGSTAIRCIKSRPR